VQNLSKGDDYEKVRKVYCISVLNFTLGEGTDYAYHGRTDFIGMHTQDRLQLSANAQKLYGKREPGDIFPEYYLFRLKQLPDVVPTDHLEEWLYFMKHSKLPENHSAPGLEEAKARFDYFRLSEADRRLYDRYREMDRDNRSVENTREYELHVALEEKAIAEQNFLVEQQRAETQQQLAEQERQRAETEHRRADSAEQAQAHLLEELRAAQEQIRRLRGLADS
jgi:hypothetical protein